MVLPYNKDACLRQLGFVQLALYRSWDYPVGNNEAAFIPITDVRYQHQLCTPDGTQLYAYAWVQEPGYLLTTQRHISAFSHIVAELETDDPVLLQQHVEGFFQSHGGKLACSDAPPGSSGPPQLS